MRQHQLIRPFFEDVDNGTAATHQFVINNDTVVYRDWLTFDDYAVKDGDEIIMWILPKNAAIEFKKEQENILKQSVVE